MEAVTPGKKSHLSTKPSLESGLPNLRDVSRFTVAPPALSTLSPGRLHSSLLGTRRLDSESEDDEPERTRRPEKEHLVPKRKPPIETRWCLIPCLLFIAYLGAAAYYFEIRVEGVINSGWPAYQTFFLVLEWVGVSAFIPYAILITRGVFPTGSPGLPPAPKDGANDRSSVLSNMTDAGQKMHVRVCVPCYKEPLEVVTATVMAALNADLPACASRTVYLCDDGKDPIKRQFIESLPEGEAVYVSGRVRKPGEVNGKSANLNNCLHRIYSDLPKDEATGLVDWAEISNKELLVVFDADMCAKPDFFLKLLEVMSDDNIALCLTPQAFHNIDPGIDLFNAINVQFWEYWLPGAFAWGYIACTGTNFCLRVRPLAHCGWFPEYTITEDYALGMELKSRGYKATYLMDYIGWGEAPEEIRNVFRQRSRWTKGHYQVFFSRKNSLINWELPFFQRLWYAYAAWAPFCTVVTVPGFMIAPLISVVWGIHPLVITYDFVLSSTIYFFIQLSIQFYVRKLDHLKLMWYVNMSNVVLWFTYTKAFINCSLAAVGLKGKVVFKATDKVVKAGDAAAPAPPKPAAESSAPVEPPPDENLLQRVARIASRTVSQMSHKIQNTFTPRKSRLREASYLHHGPPGVGASAIGPTSGGSYMPDFTKATPAKRLGSALMLPGQPEAQTPGSHHYGVQMRHMQQTQAAREADGMLSPRTRPSTDRESPTQARGGAGRGLDFGAKPAGGAGAGRLDVRFMQAPVLPDDEDVVLDLPPMAVADTPRAGEGASLTDFDSPGPSASMVRQRGAPTPGKSGMASRLASTTRAPAAPISGYAPVSGSGLKHRISWNKPEPEAHSTHSVLPGGSGAAAADKDHRGVMFAADELARGGGAHGAATAGSGGFPSPGSSTVRYQPQQSDSSFMRDIKGMMREVKDARKGMPHVALPPPVVGRMPASDASSPTASSYAGPAGGSNPYASLEALGASFGSLPHGGRGLSGGGAGVAGSSGGGSAAARSVPDSLAPPSSLMFNAGGFGAGMGGGLGLGMGGFGAGGMGMPMPMVQNGMVHLNYGGMNPLAAGNPLMGGGGMMGAQMMGATPVIAANAMMIPAVGGSAGVFNPSLFDVNAAGKVKLDSSKGGKKGKDSDEEDESDDEAEEKRRKKKDRKPSGENEARAGKERLMKIINSFKPQNISDFGQMFDPLALFLMWVFNIVTFSLGLWQLVLVFNQPTVAAFKLNSPLSGNPYLLIAALWALYNSVAPYLFLHYCFSSGNSFRTMTKYLPTLSTACMVAGVIMLWLMIPSDVQLADALELSLDNFLPNQIVADNNTNYMFVSGLNATAVSLPSLLARGPQAGLPTEAWQFASAPTATKPNLLGGLLAGPDNVKTVMPMAHTLTWLAWGAIQFPNGFKEGQLASLQKVLRAGGDYLMRANLNLNDPANPVFVAQLGDSRNYTVVDNTGYDPQAAGMVWTSPKTDPQLAGNAPRKAWLLTRETIGSDLLAGAAGALAAASVVIKPADPAWASLALRHARYLYNFATMNTTAPTSYCNFVPCTANVTVTSQTKVKPVPEANGVPVCWWADWTTYTCKVELSERDCNAKRRQITQVFLTKSGCCSMFKAAKVWDTLYTGAQGLCALPDDQWTCYTPDLAQRTCYAQDVNRTTGDGCSGPGVEVFSTPLSCCNYLNYKGVIDQSSGKGAVGMCARMQIDANITKCYIPNIVNATCDEAVGAACQQYGVVTSYDQPVSCCNNLAVMLKGTTLATTSASGTTTTLTLNGICAPYFGPSPSPMPALTLGDLGTFETDANVIDTTDPTTSDPNAVPVDTTPTATELLGDAVDLNGVLIPTRRLALETGSALVSETGGGSGDSSEQLVVDDVLRPADAHDAVMGMDESAAIAAALAASRAMDGIAAAKASASRMRLLLDDSHVFPADELTAPRDVDEAGASAAGSEEEDLAVDDGSTQRRKLAEIDPAALAALIAALDTATKTAAVTSPSPVDVNSTYWPLPTGAAFLEDPCAQVGSCVMMQLEQTQNTTYFNSSTVFDDLAWGALWLYQATGEAKYLGESQRFLERLYLEELPADVLTTQRSAYLTDWDNQAWAVNVLLAQITDDQTYHNRAKELLSVWLFGDSVPAGPVQGVDEDTIINGRTYDNFTSPATNITYQIIPDCVPTNTFEQFCFDNLDDDCNGLIDRQDPACGLFPVLYTPKEIAWSAAPTLPHAANTAFLAMVYAESVAGSSQTRLRCWALAQMGHILGSGSGERSYVVGVGERYPTIVQHRASSCPVAAGHNNITQVCDWSSGFYPSSPNPQLDLIRGAMVNGPDLNDTLHEWRSSDDMRVTLHGNAGFLSTLIGLTHTGTRVRSCESFHGVYQRYIAGGENTIS